MDEEKVYCSMYSRNAELYHHGVKGQKWGVMNGPPYPLDSNVSTGKKLKSTNVIESQFYSDKTKNDPKARHMEIWKNTTKLCYGIKGSSEEKGRHAGEVHKQYAKKLENVYNKCEKAYKEDKLTDNLLWDLAKAEWEEGVVWSNGSWHDGDSVEGFIKETYGSIKKYGDKLAFKNK